MIIQQIKRLYCNLTSAERRVATYVIESPQEVTRLTVHELAKNCDVASSAVIRFCKSIQLQGFSELKIELMLYMRDMYASNSRPVQQMIAFDKVEIAAGETKIVEFIIEEPMLRFWNNENEFVSEPGRFQISTGYADHLILTKDLYLE